MIQNLNSLTFARFGRILHGNEPWPGEPERLSVSREEAFSYRRYSKPVRLDYDQGMALLRVVGEEGSADTFYLDKAVLLYAGVAFSVVPVGESCGVRLYAGGETPQEALRSTEEGEPSILRPVLSVTDIYTLFYQEKEKGFVFRGEQHLPYELTYVDKGTMHNIVAGQDHVLAQNQMMIIGPEQWHMQYADPEEVVNFVTISFRCSLPLPEAVVNRVLFAKRGSSRLMAAILREKEEDNPYRTDRIFSLLQLLLIELIRSVVGENREEEPVAAASTVQGENQILDGALQYITGHFGEKLTVTDLAKHCSVSSAYLSLLFQKNLHQSPAAYMRRIRLEESKQLLRRGNMNVSQIAAMLQFSSVQHFSRAFRQYYGITPSAYSKALK